MSVATGTIPDKRKDTRHACPAGGVDAATTINVAVFNAAIGTGALLGGLIINRTGPALIPTVSDGFVLAGLILILATRNHSD